MAIGNSFEYSHPFTRVRSRGTLLPFSVTLTALGAGGAVCSGKRQLRTSPAGMNSSNRFFSVKNLMSPWP